MSDVTGGCRCGAIRYRSSEPPVVTRMCWCRDCQYWGSGSATVNVFFKTDTLTIEGERGRFESDADSGTPMFREFCPKCGTPVFTGAHSRPHLLGIRAGTLDEIGAYAPSSVIWTESAPEWAQHDPELPLSGRQPAPLA